MTLSSSIIDFLILHDVFISLYDLTTTHGARTFDLTYTSFHGNFVGVVVPLSGEAIETGSRVIGGGTLCGDAHGGFVVFQCSLGFFVD